MVPPRELPGMYWDDTKKKYFAIQANHKQPAGAAYSVDSVKRRKIDTAYTKEQQEKSSRRQGLVKRALPSHALLGCVLSREQGGTDGLQYQETTLRGLVHGWNRSHVVRRNNWNWHNVRVLPEGIERIEHFAWDPLSTTLSLGTRSGHIGRLRESLRPREQDNVPDFSGSNVDMFYHYSGGLAALEFNTATNTFIYCGREPKLRHDGSRNNVAMEHFNPQDDPDGPVETGVSLLYIGDARSLEDTMVFTATPAPATSTDNFACGTSTGIWTIDNERRGNGTQVVVRSSDVVSLEYLSHSPNVVLAGHRNGCIDAVDRRVKPAKRSSSNASNLCLSHIAGISNVKQLTDHSVVVSGLNSALCIYDLRYSALKPRAEVSEWENVGHSRGAQKSITRPMLVINEHENNEYMDAGFAVDKEAGLIAAVQTGRTNAVKIFSGTTGTTLRTIVFEARESVTTASARLTSLEYFPRPMRFVADRGEGHAKSLWIGAKDEIHKYSW